jgi:hypothetical protein
MSNSADSKGYTSSARVSTAPGAFIHIPAANFGAKLPAAPVGTASATSGSLSTTAYTKVAWVTSEGISLPSAETATTLSGDTAVSIAQPTVPTGGAAVIGWVIYEGATTGSETALKAANESTQAQQVFVTNSGNVTAFPIATTTVVVLKVGTGAGVQTIDNSGIQDPFPAVPGDQSLDYYFVVPNTGSQWKTQKSVQVMRPDGVTETEGIILSTPLDCLQPLYIGGVSPYTATAVSLGTYMVMNGYLFQATVSGTTATAFIGFAAFNLTKGATTTDGSVTWTSFGKAALVRAHFANVTSGSLTPVTQSYDLFEL